MVAFWSLHTTGLHCRHVAAASSCETIIGKIRGKCHVHCFVTCSVIGQTFLVTGHLDQSGTGLYTTAILRSSSRREFCTTGKKMMNFFNNVQLNLIQRCLYLVWEFSQFQIACNLFLSLIVVETSSFNIMIRCLFVNCGLLGGAWQGCMHCAVQGDSMVILDPHAAGMSFMSFTSLCAVYVFRNDCSCTSNLLIMLATHVNDQQA